MAEFIALDFFETSEISILKARIEEVAESNHRVRKKTFADRAEDRKAIRDLEERLSILERHICKGGE